MKRTSVSSILMAILVVALGLPLAFAATTVSPRLVESQWAGGINSAFGGDLAANIPERWNTSCRFTNGTGTGKVDLAPFIRRATLGTGASTTYDLTSYLDAAGNTVSTMTKLKFLRIENTGTVAIDVGGAAATQFVGTGWLKGGTDILTIAGGQDVEICVDAGITVSGTVKSLKVLNTSGATAAAYTIIAVGSST